MLNRAALILRHKQPFVDWINSVDPTPASPALTLADTEDERAVYLIGVEDEDELARWLVQHHEELFEQELHGWYTDPAMWPQDRTLKTLQEWCSFDLNTVVLDFGESPIQDDEL